VAGIRVEEEEGEEEARVDMDVVVDRTTAIVHSQGVNTSALDDTFDDARSQILVNESSDAAYKHMWRLCNLSSYRVLTAL